MSDLRQWILRIWRLIALAMAAWLLHVAAQQRQHHARASSISPEQARKYFPIAAEVVGSEQEKAPDEIFDADGRRLGFIALTSPQADSIIGYSGPNNVLVAMNSSGRIIGLELVASSDTEAHVKEVKGATAFWKQFLGWTPSHEPLPKIEAVGGSTLTSLGIAEAMQKRLAGRVDSLRFPEPLTLKEVKSFFPGAASFANDEPRPGWHAVKDAEKKLLGFAVRTSPLSDFTFGHSGPTESLIAVAPDGDTLLGVRLRRSYDTDDYADSVREDTQYLKQLTNFSVTQWAKLDLKKAGLEGVSGATETSFAVADGLRRRFAADAVAPVQRTLLKARDWALLGIVAGSLVMTFTSLRGRRAVRIVWQGILIAVFGLWFGDLLSLALVAGWARNGVAWQVAPSLVMLVAIALLVPWATRRQIYCYQLCPHGAAQEWLGRFPKLHFHISDRIAKYLRVIPGILLVVAFFLALKAPRFELAGLEPFDAWAMRGAVLAATVLAIAGLVASLFVPMAYCRFGCPTGALLKFIRTTGSNEHFGLRDKVAAGLLITGSLLLFWPAHRVAAPSAETTTELHGTCFGTTWSVKLRHAPSNSSALQRALALELERIESTLSHWRSNSATSQFNAARTTQPIEMPGELIALVARCQNLSRVSDGAYDITVAPLVKAWGFGPGGIPPTAPTDDEVDRLRSFTGWQKLSVDTKNLTLQKTHPQLQIDLGSILQGYAGDRLATILNEQRVNEYLINVGGELLAKGKWRVAIEDPAHPSEPLRVVDLQDAALATSGTYRAKHSDGQKHWSHLINPQTGRPVAHETTLVSVVTSSCGDADAWATALLVGGEEKAKTLAATSKLSILTVSGGRTTDLHFLPNVPKP